MEPKKTIIALLVLLVAAMAIVPCVSAVDIKDPYYKDILITEMGSLTDDIQKTVALKNSESDAWYAKLQKVTDESRPGLEKFLYPNGSVIGWGHDRYGTMSVQINKDSKISSSEIQEIYSVIKKTGEANGINNIPCKFISMGLMKTESRTDKIRPLIGGLQIASSGGWGTMGFRARDSSGNLGFVTSGHLGSVGSTFYQPDLYGSTYAVGTMRIQGSTRSDSGFIRYSNTDPSVYINDATSMGYSSYLNNPTYYTIVYKSGAATDITSGEVQFIHEAWNPHLSKYLPQQAYADYDSDEGDSGAPVFTWDYFDPVLVGIHMGQAEPDTGVFSPISGIKSDLGITPAL